MTLGHGLAEPAFYGFHAHPAWADILSNMGTRSTPNLIRLIPAEDTGKILKEAQLYSQEGEWGFFAGETFKGGAWDENF